MTRHLARLEREGYVERRPDEADKRQMLVYPTQKLLELVPDLRQSIQEWDAYLFSDISPEELEQFNDTLLKITQRAQEYVNSKDVVDG